MAIKIRAQMSASLARAAADHFDSSGWRGPADRWRQLEACTCQARKLAPSPRLDVVDLLAY